MLKCWVRKSLRPALTALALGAMTLSFTGAARALGPAAKGVFVGNEFYAPTVTWQNNARVSGFTTLCLFTMHVQSNGNLDYNGTPIVTNGVYVGDSTWGAKLAACKAAPSSVNRIELTIGGWGDPSFTNIKNLIASQGTGSSSILYRSFQALKNAIGIDAIQYDDEQTYDSGSAVSFGNMISGLGMKVTLCPYTAQAFWVSVRSQLGAKVDAIYLQCYDGGAGNDPGNWNSAFGGFKVYPGLWGNTDTPGSAAAKMRGWQNNLGITGGFMWLNGSLPGDAPKWAETLHIGLDPIAFFNIVNQNSGRCVDLINGNTANGAVVNQWGFDSNSGNQRWSLVPSENGDHFKLISWTSGKCLGPAADSINAGVQITDSEYSGNNTAQQWDLIDTGNGWHNIKNVKSGLVLDVAGNSTADNGMLDQWPSNGQANQRFRLQPWGNYYLQASTGKYICVQGAGTTNGSAIIQYDGQSNPWFRWTFTSVGDGWYDLFSVNAPTRVISVQNASIAANAPCVLWDYNAASHANSTVRVLPKTNGKYKFYFQHDGMSWDIPGGGPANNTPLQQFPDNAGANQEFAMERS
ncbi:MAG: (lysyl endopeptidase) subfamily protein [Capsulimonas sp.]|nr:(lysyl endopeptidase) subfamily protein [Capsulimonas sp.]